MTTVALIRLRQVEGRCTVCGRKQLIAGLCPKKCGGRKARQAHVDAMLAESREAVNPDE